MALEDSLGVGLSALLRYGSCNVMKCKVWAELSTWPHRLAALALLVLACQEAPPTRIKLDFVDMVLSSDPVQVLVWKWDDKNTRSQHKGNVDLSVEPADLAAVTATGQLTCSRSGDGKVIANVAGVTDSHALECRPVDHIEAGDLGRIDMADGPVPLGVAVFDAQGKILDDVPLSITTRNASVARGAGQKLEPVSIGKAKILVKAGKVAEEFDVSVVRRLKPEALPMNNDTRINFSLEPGRYELIVELESEKELRAEWRGAPYCDYKKTAKRHVIDCKLRSSGGVVFDNPAYLNSGSKEVSHAGVEIREVPER
jgi:hypothetical protein